MPSQPGTGQPAPTRRYILTGPPGAGKTSILDALGRRGWAVVPEAATDVIAAAQARGVDEPWKHPRFIDDVVSLQRLRQIRAVAGGGGAQLYDRSPLCTVALATYLGHPVSPMLADEVDRLIEEGVYARKVFFVRPIGFVEVTAARRIGYEESVEFGAVHEAVYRSHGFELVNVPAGEVERRASMIEEHLRTYQLPCRRRPHSARVHP